MLASSNISCTSNTVHVHVYESFNGSPSLGAKTTQVYFVSFLGAAVQFSKLNININSMRCVNAKEHKY